MDARALIAEDEPLLAEALRRELARAWPALDVVDSVADGATAVRQALALLPDVVFLDIRMPGQSGLDAAVELAERWPAAMPLPAVVFVTAFDHYAVQAFDAQAADYLVKPVQPERLARTVQRLQARLAQRRQSQADTDAQTLAQLRDWLARQAGPLGTAPAADGAAPLAQIQAGVGNAIHLVPVEQVLAFEAADKYVRLLTAGREYLIRTPLKELLPRLDAQRFWQIHRGTVVQAAAIDTVVRDEHGRLQLTLRGLQDERFAVSRLYAHLFRAM
ncbi:LytR/AlgR family response regulator transcription factor [Pseudorhodoferax sp.]|uniref:LytR/AlgR family response regulator transcription factor n=1 Tax=Pseudorhodoferax sp. TaxID=1993553 RepID=UPI0039E67D90